MFTQARHRKYHEFLLTLNDLRPSSEDPILDRIQFVTDKFNLICTHSRIIVALVLRPSHIGPVNTVKVFLGLQESLDPVNLQYFIGESYKGNKIFAEYLFKVIDSKTKGCRASFANCI